jgi:hypothetical protein
MHKKEFKINIIILICAIATALTIGTLTFMALEGWSAVNAFYFVTMTATTVGYGDFTPTHDLSKIITIVYSLSIIPFVIYTFSIIAKFQTERVYRKLTDLERKQREEEGEIEKTERKLAEERKKLKEQKEELTKHEKELKGHQKKIRQQTELNEQQEEEIKEHEQELEVVEDIVEKELEREKRAK